MRLGDPLAGKEITKKGSGEAFLRATVETTSDECIRWPYGVSDKDYGLVTINGKQRSASHWICTMAHGEPVAPRVHAAHSCGHPRCVNPNHIRWATHQENMSDRRIHGTENIGERNGKTRLTEDDVRAIRAAPPILKPLMEKYGMSRDGITKIRGGNRWGHVK